MNSANIQDRSASGTPVIGSAVQYSKFKIGFSRKRTAGYIIENVFENDVAALASWKSASHVEVPPKKKTPPPTP